MGTLNQPSIAERPEALRAGEAEMVGCQGRQNFGRVVRVAGNSLPDASRRVIDEEDMFLSAFR